MIGTSVVVGVDGSTEAKDAVVLGQRLATSAVGTLHLVAAVTEPLTEVVATRVGMDTDRLQTALLKEAVNYMTKDLAELVTPDALDQSLQVRFGRPEHVLAEYGSAVNADAFVLGGRRHRVPASWFRRGTAHHLLRVGGRPVLVTGPDGPDVRRVVVAVDLSSAAEGTICVAADLAQLLGTNLEAVFVVSPLHLERGRAVEFESHGALEQQKRCAEEQLWPLLPRGTARRILQGNPTSIIAKAARDGPPTLLVIGAQGRGRVHRLLLGSTTETLLARLPTALAIVPVRETV